MKIQRHIFGWMRKCYITHFSQVAEVLNHTQKTPCSQASSQLHMWTVSNQKELEQHPSISSATNASFPALSRTHSLMMWLSVSCTCFLFRSVSKRQNYGPS
jgi:hypothetical protein